MKLIHAATELGNAGRKVCVAIGFFDGVHLGHQQIIRQTITDARQQEAIALVVTFDCHPSTVVAPERVPPLIYSLPQRLRTIESLGADALLLIRFDKEFSEKPGALFVDELARDLGQIRSVCVGSNFKFGHKRDGDVALLKKLGGDLKFAVHGMAAVSLDGETVSSTRIRETIRAGNFDVASQMLGRAYSLAGEIIRGDGVGRQFGYPTANIDVAGLILPPTGVYAVHATVEGRKIRAALNIGYRPTLREPNPSLHVEAHLLDFSGDLYGKEMEVTFGQKLRAEQKFSSLEELKYQIARDVAEVRMRF